MTEIIDKYCSTNQALGGMTRSMFNRFHNDGFKLAMKDSFWKREFVENISSLIRKLSYSTLSEMFRILTLLWPKQEILFNGAQILNAAKLLSCLLVSIICRLYQNQRAGFEGWWKWIRKHYHQKMFRFEFSSSRATT